MSQNQLKVCKAIHRNKSEDANSQILTLQKYLRAQSKDKIQSAFLFEQLVDNGGGAWPLPPHSGCVSV